MNVVSDANATGTSLHMCIPLNCVLSSTLQDLTQALQLSICRLTVN